MRRKAHAALEQVAWLERQSAFISPFFMGKTSYEFKKKEHDDSLKSARERFELLKQYL